MSNIVIYSETDTFDLFLKVVNKLNKIGITVGTEIESKEGKEYLEYLKEFYDKCVIKQFYIYRNKFLHCCRNIITCKYLARTFPNYYSLEELDNRLDDKGIYHISFIDNSKNIRKHDINSFILHLYFSKNETSKEYDKKLVNGYLVKNKLIDNKELIQFTSTLAYQISQSGVCGKVDKLEQFGQNGLDLFILFNLEEFKTYLKRLSFKEIEIETIWRQLGTSPVICQQPK